MQLQFRERVWGAPLPYALFLVRCLVLFGITALAEATRNKELGWDTSSWCFFSAAPN